MIGISPLARNYLRTRSTRLMVDECVITRPGPQTVTYDAVTRKSTLTNGTGVYSGVCRLWQVSAGSSTWAQDKKLTATTTYLSIPYGEAVEPDDIVTMTLSDDPEIIGRGLRVEAPTRGGGLRGSRVMRVTFIDTEEEGDL